MASPQSEKDCLLVSLELVDGINPTVCTQPYLPLIMVVISDDCLCLFVGHRMAELLHFAACLCESVSLFVPSDSTVGRDPLKCDG